MKRTRWIVVVLTLVALGCAHQKATRKGPMVLGSSGDDEAGSGGATPVQTVQAGETIRLEAGQVLSLRSPVPFERVNNTGAGSLRVSVDAAKQTLELGAKKPGEFAVQILDDAHNPQLEFTVIIE